MYVCITFISDSAIQDNIISFLLHCTWHVSITYLCTEEPTFVLSFIYMWDIMWPPAPFPSCYLARNLKEVARAWSRLYTIRPQKNCNRMSVTLIICVKYLYTAYWKSATIGLAIIVKMGYVNAPIVIKIKLRFAATVFHTPAACAWSILGQWATGCKTVIASRLRSAVPVKQRKLY